MKQLLTYLLISLSINTAISQTINFTDLELKRYLINEPCVDTTTIPNNNMLGHHDVDINNDNEIQLNEALSIKKIYVKDFDDKYSIKSIQDLEHFKNLTFLGVGQIDSIEEISNLKLDSLNSLHIWDCSAIKRIDISNLTNLTDLIRIEGLVNLDYINVQNGSVSKAFSLFYTQHTKYACVDSIAKEYNMFNDQGAMLTGVLPTFNCVTTGIDNTVEINNLIKIYPNPTNGIFEIESKNDIKRMTITNTIGKIVFETSVITNSIDISHLTNGIYFIRLEIDNQSTVKKVIKY